MPSGENSGGAPAWTVETVSVCGGQIPVARSGSGAPVVVFPRDTGHAPKNAFLDLLAREFTVYHPRFPGFHGGGAPAEWDWMANVRDLAVLQHQLLLGLGLESPALVGLGFGGWVAAELATMSSPGALALIAPMGIQPVNGYIYDQFLFSTESYVRTCFADQAIFDDLYGREPEYEQLDAWETDREMTSRLAWKPYMYNRSLPRLLGGVSAPALVVWGDADQVVPAECGELYRAALPHASLEFVPESGHAVDLEQPAALAARVIPFLKRATR